MSQLATAGSWTTSPRDDAAVRDMQRLMHKTIRRVGEDIDRFKFNTALAGLMEYTNGLNQFWEDKGVHSEHWAQAISSLLTLMCPMAPHISEELWELAGHKGSVHENDWPLWDEELAADEVFTLVVQVNGRVRDKIEVPVSISQDAAETAALESNRVAPHIQGKNVVRVIYVPGKLVNVVAR